MEKFTIQVKVLAIFDVERSAENILDALASGGTLKWKDFLLSGTIVSDGTFKIVGVFANDWKTMEVDNL